MKTAVITGIKRGIGKALTEKFLDSGYFVIGTSTNGTIPEQHKNLKVFQLDLADATSIRECATQISALGKPIDVLINNAGIWIDDGDVVLRIDKLRKILEVNLIGTIDFTEQMIPLVADSGHIVNISSKSGSMSAAKTPSHPDYKISKAGLNMATRIWALRLKDRITVSAVHPGWVKTDLGGPNADMEPAEAAEYILTLATAKVETGQFWFKGKKFPW